MLSQHLCINKLGENTKIGREDKQYTMNQNNGGGGGWRVGSVSQWLEC